MQEADIKILAMLEEIRDGNLTMLQKIFSELNKLRQAVWDLQQEDKISYTLKEAAPLTGLAYETLYNLFKSGKLKGSQVAGKGGSILVLRQDLIEFIATRKPDDEILFQESDLIRLLRKAKKYKR